MLHNNTNIVSGNAHAAIQTGVHYGSVTVDQTAPRPADLNSVIAETRMTMARLETEHDMPIREIQAHAREWLSNDVFRHQDGTWGTGWYMVSDAGRELLQLLNAIEIVPGRKSLDGTHTEFLRLTEVGVILRDFLITPA